VAQQGGQQSSEYFRRRIGLSALYQLGKIFQSRRFERRSFRGANIVPNAAHKALAQLEQEYDGEVTVVTQNIDFLHEQAGSKRVIHMHGRDGEIRCMHCGTVFASDVDLTPQSVCAHCKTVGELRPNIVWFGEMPLHMDEINAALRKAAAGPMKGVLEVTDEHRRFWLALFTVTELVEIAEASWGARSGWGSEWRDGFVFMPSRLEEAA